ncbi:MAG: hypothetical protein DYG98_27840 [Haliscomenobacteraceae bacterium CHB4]|nr:hypothetical protein [Saprospiraceae bacterium]MCE7926865.1 hypothetical protein [Haliscomenobacteraceae bacterium CHB4]
MAFRSFICRIWPLLLLAEACKPALQVAPTQVRGGEMVFISRDKQPFDTAKVYSVRFGSETAPILGVDTHGRLMVMAPNQPEGARNISVSADGRKIGTRRLTLLPPLFRQALFTLDSAQNFRLLSTRPLAGIENRAFSPAQEKLAYDVLSERGDLLFSDAIPFPTLEIEVFEEGNREFSRTRASITTFSLKIPNLPQAGLIRFFRVAPGVGIYDPEDRRKRVLLQEFKL